jgi:hypothetical protein
MEIYRIKHHGDCLAPLGITDKSKLIGIRLTDWQTDDIELLKYVGKIIAIKVANSKTGLMKVFANYDIMNKELWLMQLNPKITMHIPLAAVEDILLIQIDKD